MKNLNRITTLSMLIAVAIVLNVIEISINVIPVPGAKNWICKYRNGHCLIYVWI